MYLQRKIDLFLQNWKEELNKKPLIVKGPRQVGKTESIRYFAEKIMRIWFISTLSKSQSTR